MRTATMTFEPCRNGDRISACWHNPRCRRTPLGFGHYNEVRFDQDYESHVIATVPWDRVPYAAGGDER